jgi:hypothetical protein
MTAARADADHQVARVRSDGAINWRGELFYLSEALVGELLGIAEIRLRSMVGTVRHG